MGRSELPRLEKNASSRIVGRMLVWAGSGWASQGFGGIVAAANRGMLARTLVKTWSKDRARMGKRSRCLFGQDTGSGNNDWRLHSRLGGFQMKIMSIGMIRARLACRCVATAALAISTAPVLAQSTAAASSRSQAQTLGEIVVNARKLSVHPP